LLGLMVARISPDSLSIQQLSISSLVWKGAAGVGSNSELDELVIAGGYSGEAKSACFRLRFVRVD
jgi:hypothetical protein